MSFHRNNFVVAVKDASGQVLRESVSDSQPTVYLPFDSEYSLYFRNRNSKRAVVRVFIDGMDVAPGNSFVVNAYDTASLERFMLDGNLSAGQKFRFVRASDGRVQDPDNPQNGRVRVEVRYEKLPTMKIVSPRVIWGYHYYPYFSTGSSSTPPLWEDNRTYSFHASPNIQPLSTSFSAGASSNVASASSNVSVNYMATMDSASSDQKGATVEGARSGQSFGTTYVGELETEVTVFDFRLLAPKADQPITVADTRFKYCPDCGTRARGSDRYCSKCGRNIE